MRALSLGLGLDADRLQKALGGDDEGVCIRVNFYPRCPRPDLALGLSPHSDPGGMTVLLADDHVHGLQVCKDGVSDIPIGPVPELLAVTGRSALYRPMTFDDYRLFIRRKGPRGKSQVESLEAMAIPGT
ncbi:hypothetical protein C4D60_Mb07t13900 [Musa balbisiana]|uniref:Isopenicillin N synthase-like Fe(2+) 2OG dioxygenase domain-containing protein n=1 Tax=Musa balbisiana TaxID=52838 RepID=A0A4S8JH38_MUSBA|nr:hypothetical protein C4D60_Mb07t13900 [Musa balbisiana]